MVYEQCIDDTQSLSLGYLGDIIQWDDQLLRYTHDARVETDIVLCYVHSTLMEDPLREGTPEIIEDNLLFWQRKKLADLVLRRHF